MRHDEVQTTPAAEPVAASLAAHQAQRRRALLKGLSKGGAALAVVAPIRTMAAPTIVGGTKLCTVSGVMSNVGSHATGLTGECKGYSPNYYKTLANWPGYVATPTPVATNTVDSITFTQLSTFAAVFGSGTNTTGMLDEITASSATADEVVWMVALLNAIKNPAGYNFPYTPSQVRAFYLSSDATLKANALAFFKGYMQTVG